MNKIDHAIRKIEIELRYVEQKIKEAKQELGPMPDRTRNAYANLKKYQGEEEAYKNAIAILKKI